MTKQPLSTILAGRAREVWRESIRRARQDIFGRIKGMPGENEWLKPLRGRSRTRWYWPSKYLHMDFTLQHYLAMQLKRMEAREDHPSIKKLWDTVRIFAANKSHIEKFMETVDHETFTRSATLHDAQALLTMIGEKSGGQEQLNPATNETLDADRFRPFVQYALSPLRGIPRHLQASNLRKNNTKLRHMLASDGTITNLWTVRNRFVDALYLRRRAYYLAKLMRKKPISETIQKYRKHFTVHPDQKVIWPDNKGISQHSWPSR
ncbi:hypothetical protein, conserved [Babesia bigemina]|uniref:Uncharacterized protein n=1 Tax=Babesia bigemina TaxID=5866 RepID=A0A061DDL3_BABBI|nr:hypothetical protein, conserved [Babesia bigemina]CDR96350.1 hypothetical protein, conserved [Babesia bigemina]|eukprot:XP_012768536.1 hypothetical protein, conserved [Babesia bigemina]